MDERTRHTLAYALALALPLLSTSCATPPIPRVHRTPFDAVAPRTIEQMVGAQEGDQAPTVQEATPPNGVPGTATSSLRPLQTDPPSPRPRFYGAAAAFNFSDESIQGVAKAILGELLQQRYTIAPGVQGTVTLVSPTPISPEEALRLLERGLINNGLRLIYNNGSFHILPADQALGAGMVTPTPRDTPGRGFQSKLVPLRWIAAAEMEKLLKPYARPNAIIDVDASRNQLTLAGSQEELANYLRLVDTFDVDWMAQMSMASIPVASGRPSALAGDLERIFGAASGLPLAGIVRFIPLDGAGVLVAIAPRQQVLDQVIEWVDRFDSSGGDAPRIYSYDLKYLGAKDLASRLGQVVNQASLGSLTEGAPSSGSEGKTNADTDMPIATTPGFGDISVSAVEETNSVLVRATPAAWRSLREAIARIDVMPLQVRIEAQILEVHTSGSLRHGVSWYFDQAVTAPADEGGLGLPEEAPTGWRSLGGIIRPAEEGVGWVFRGRSAAAVVSILDQVGDVQVLQTPSVFVRNNTEAHINAGSRIPVVSVRVDPTGSENAYSQVQYLDTGLVLKVKPRATREGMVFLDIEQEVSTPGGANTADANGNVRIDTNKLKTQVTVQAGDTLMLAGLTRQDGSRTASGAPGLTRIPVLGGLFGGQAADESRDELVMLITAIVSSDAKEVRALTDEYLKRFRAIKPVRHN